MKFSQIDDLTRSDHAYLQGDDECLYLREYTSGQGYGHSETNDLISNFKKKPDRRGRPEYRYKEQAIWTLADELRGANLNRDWFAKATLVPIPPSKVRGHPLHDDRMLQVVRRFSVGTGYDVRELIVQRDNMEAAHESARRPTPFELEANYYVEESLASPHPTAIALFDDVLTTGSHFRAAKRLLRTRFPDVRVVGIFVARRVFATRAEDDGP